MKKSIFIALTIAIALVLIGTTSASALVGATKQTTISADEASTTIAQLLAKLEDLSKQLDAKLKALELKAKCSGQGELNDAEINACKKENKNFSYDNSRGNNSKSNGGNKGNNSGSNSQKKQDAGLDKIMKQLDKLFGNGKSGSGLQNLLGQGGGCSGGACPGSGLAGGTADGTGALSGMGKSAFGGKPTEVIKCNCNEDKPTETGTATTIKPNNKGLSVYLAVGGKTVLFDNKLSLGPVNQSSGQATLFDTTKITTTTNVFGSFDPIKIVECKYTDEGQKTSDKKDCDKTDKVKTKQASQVTHLNIGSNLPVLYSGPSWCGDCKVLEGQIGPYAGMYRQVTVPPGGVSGVSAYPTLRVPNGGDVVGSGSIISYLRSNQGK